MTPAPPPVRPSRGAGYPAAVLVAALVFAAVAPTLDWLEFSGGSENLVVGAVVEIERGGPVLVPNLQGAPRVKKPPLPTWVADLGVHDATARDLSSPDRATRDAAFTRLAFEVRWTSLACACLMLVAAYALGRVVAGGDGRVGLAAAAMAGSTVMFLRFGRAATTDVHLALWVTVANACLAAAVLRGRVWVGALGGGAAAGLAFMSKGPVALLQSAVPFAAFMIWRAWDRRRAAAGTSAEVADAHGRGRHVLAALVGLLVFLIVALPWYVAVAVRQPGVVHEWFAEVSRTDATELPPDPWYVYLVLFFYVAPWVAWFVAGAFVGTARLFGKVPAPGADGARSRVPGFPIEPVAPDADAHGSTRLPAAAAAPPGDDGQTLVLSLLLTFVPVVVMSLFKDKNERYLFPLAAPAAVLAAQALVRWVDAGRPNGGGAVVARVGQWLTVALFAVGAPVAAALLKTVDGEPWISPLTAAVFTAVGAAIVLTGLRLDARRPFAVVAAGAAVMSLVQYPMLAGYRDYPQGRAELKPLADVIWSAAPDADVYELDVAGRTRARYDLPIYLNRLTRKTADPSAMQQGERPVALVYFASRRAAEPSLPPPWRMLAEGADGKSRWKLFLLPKR